MVLEKKNRGAKTSSEFNVASPSDAFDNSKWPQKSMLISEGPPEVYANSKMVP